MEGYNYFIRQIQSLGIWMGFDQDFEIQSTLRPNLFVCTTGISEEEKRLVRSHLPRHVILEDVLTTNTNYLVTYKAMMTDKYIQALKWNIKILSMEWLYDVDGNTKRYEMQPFEGSCFTTSEISNDIFINYYCQLGAAFRRNLTVSTDFLVSSSSSNEKVDFCKKYGIPTVVPEDVFRNNYDVYRKEHRFEAMSVAENGLFDDKVFFLDPELPKILFNVLRRKIIEGGGTRVSNIDKDVGFILTFGHERFKDHGERIYHYQYVFDCVETGAILFPGPYRVYSKVSRPVLSSTVCCVDPSLGDNSASVVNKLRALGAVVKTAVDMNCTHLIIKDKKEYRKNKQTSYKVVLSEWIDQCLYVLKHVREDKYLVRTRGLNLLGRWVEDMPTKRVTCIVPRAVLFQFTSLPPFLKKKAVEKLERLNIRYSDTNKYESCTHLIMGTVNTSEKFLCCLCNGGWILRPDFIDKFDNTPNFDFSRYEWTVSEDTLEKDRKIISAIRRWRERVEESGRPAFHKWVVKLYCEDQKRDSYSRVIENGGGRMATDDHHTHCFVSRTYKGEVNAEKKYSTDYIFSYLFQ